MDRTVVEPGGLRRGSTRPFNSAFRIPHSALGWCKGGSGEAVPHWWSGAVGVRAGIDVGGTFTDLVALREDGAIEVRKVVTTPDDPAVGMFRALDALNGGRPRPPIDLLVNGTTIATNALLERTGARVVLVDTLDLEDTLWIRSLDRCVLVVQWRANTGTIVPRPT